MASVSIAVTMSLVCRLMEWVWSSCTSETATLVNPSVEVGCGAIPPVGALCGRTVVDRVIPANATTNGPTIRNRLRV